MKKRSAQPEFSDVQIHPYALVDGGARIAARSKIWAFAHILSGAVIGEDCNICDHTFIEGKVVLGNRVTVKCGVYLWDGVMAEDDVFIGPSAVFTNDLKPRSRQRPENYVQTILKQGCSVGANSTIVAGTTIGAWSLIGAGSVVTGDVPDYGVVWGNPAQFRYWMCQCTEKMNFDKSNKFFCHCGENYELNGESKTVSRCL